MRSIMIGVIPLIALDTFGNKETIAQVYFFSSIFILAFTLNINKVEKALNRRRLFVLGGFSAIFAVIFFYTQNNLLFTVGITLRNIAGSIVTICISLFIMDNINKSAFKETETLRMWYVGLAWMIGPFTGVWLYENAPEPIIYIFAILFAIALILYFRHMQTTTNTSGIPKKSTEKKEPNPLQATAKFASQKRLRIAYYITLIRSTYWVALFIYGPIYVVEAGLPAWIGGALLSIVSGLLLFAPLIRRIAERFGTRQVIIVCLCFIGVSMICLGLLRETRPVGVYIFLVSAIGGVTVDCLTHIPFMRFVRPTERVEMTMVYTTWRETASLLSQGLVWLTLLVAPIWVYYILLGLLQFSAAIATSYLPRRM